MIQHLIYLALLLVLPIAAHLRWASPSRLFAVATLCFGLIAVVSAVEYRAFLSEVLARNEIGQTRYVVARVGSFAVGAAVVMAAITIVVWLQERFAAMFYPRVTKALFWLIHSAILIWSFWPVLIWPHDLPRRYIDYADRFETLYRVGSASSFAGCVGVVAIAVLAIWSVIRRVRSKTP